MRDIAARCRGTNDTENGLQKNQQGCLHYAPYSGASWCLQPLDRASTQYRLKSFNQTTRRSFDIARETSRFLQTIVIQFSDIWCP